MTLRRRPVKPAWRAAGLIDYRGGLRQKSFICKARAKGHDHGGEGRDRSDCGLSGDRADRGNRADRAGLARQLPGGRSLGCVIRPLRAGASVRAGGGLRGPALITALRSIAIICPGETVPLPFRHGPFAGRDYLCHSSKRRAHHTVTWRALNVALPVVAPQARKGTIVSVRIVSTWIAVFAVIAIALGTLTVTSQGELPYVQTDQVHTAPAWG
jgi:hypothetical protein